MFYHVCSKYSEYANDEGGVPSWTEHDLILNLQNVSKQECPKLWAKFCLYNGSIFRWLLKLIDKVDMTCDNELF